MRRLSRSLALLLLSLGLAHGGCKRTQASDTSPGSTGATEEKAERPARVRRKPGLPRPLRLPAQSPILVHLQSPGDDLAALSAYAPQMPPPRELLAELAGQVPGAGPLESALANVVDLDRSWDAASVDGELIVQIPIEPRQLGAVAQLLSDKPKVGRFGAVDLQRAEGPLPTLAWLDKESKALTLANSERGLATGRHLAREYGKKHPLRLELTGAEARKYAPQFTLEQLMVEGEGAHRFELTAKGVPEAALARLDTIEAGALTGLLEYPKIAAGVSTKYRDYDKDVRKILGDLKYQVDRQNFLVKGTLQDLVRRLGAVMRSWNGRTMVGVGPANHVLVGFGTDSTKKMGGSLAHLLNGVIDNLSLARTIGVSVPKIRFLRSIDSAAGHNISVIELDGARRYLPPEAAGLIDDKGRLRIAVGFPPHTGAGMVVVGPKCQTVMKQWLEATVDATPASDSAQDFVAATFAADPNDVIPLLSGGGDPAALLGLSAKRDPARMTVLRKGDQLTVKVDGPKATRRPRHAGARRVDPRVQPGRMPGRTAPGGGKPARTPPPTSKPVR